MKKTVISLSLLFAAIAAHPAAHAADATLAIEQMASVVLKLESKPDKNAIRTLDDIAKNSASTNNERLLATTIKGLDQKIRPDDKAAVMKVWLSPAASENERAMAKILLRFDQTASDDAKQTLSKWAEK